jgi:hypothetical protein
MADETVRQRLDNARTEPTTPLCLGTDTETDEPVTLSRSDRFDPMLISGNVATGKTTLCHHIVYQQLAPESGLCYVSGVTPALDPSVPPERTWTSIAHDSSWDPSNAVPDDIGTDATIHSVGIGGETKRNTDLTNAIIERVFQNRSADPNVQPYTLVLDGLAALDLDQLALDKLLRWSRKLGLHVILVAQSTTTLPEPIPDKQNTPFVAAPPWQGASTRDEEGLK